MSDVKVDVKLNMPRILNKVENDEFGLFLSHSWHRLITPWTPHRDGLMERSVLFYPFKFTYTQPWSHIMYNGLIYVDPIFKVGGFTNDGGITWFSRPGVKKVPSVRRFNYSKDHNPFATDHWDQKAEQAGQKRKLITEANNYLRRLG